MKKWILRCFGLAIYAAAGVLALGSGSAMAQAYPNKPVRWIVPFPPAGAMDVIARTLAERMSASMGQQFVVENRPGAGGNIGSEVVARSAPDGYTIMIASIGLAVNPSLYSKMAFDPQKDLEPIALLAVVPNMLVAHPSLGAKSVKEVIDLARAQPGKLTYASAGNGTSIHLAGELFALMAGVDMVHIPYKGSGPAVTDLIGGQVNIMFDSITSASPHVKSGKLRAYAITTAKRSQTLPNLPTIAESGLPGYDLSPWFATFAPAGTPRAIVDKLNAEMLRAINLPEVRQRMDAIGAEVIGGTPDQLRAHLRGETERWSRVIRERGIKAD